MKQFSRTKGVALLTVLLLILILSLLMSQITQLLLKDMRSSKNSEFNNLSAIYIEFIQSHFKDLFSESLTQSNASIKKTTIFAVEDYNLEFQGFQVKFMLQDLSNCFNINALFMERDGALIIDQKALLFLNELLAIMKFNEAEINTIVDQIIDWVDSDNLPRAYGAENFYYTNPNNAPQRYTSKRLFFHASELRQIPGLRNFYERIQDAICVIPYSTDFMANINTLTPNNVLFFSAFLKGQDMDTAEAIVNRIPNEGYKNIQDFYNTELELADTQFANYLTTRSHALSLTIMIDSGFTSSTFISLMSLKNNSLINLDTYKN